MKRINTSFRRISLFLWLLCLPLATQATDYINMEGAMMAYQGSSQSSIKMKIMFDDWGGSHYYVKELTVVAKYTDANKNLKIEPLLFLRSGSSYYDEEAKNVINIGCNGYAHYYDNDYQAPTLWCGIQALKGTVVVTNGYGGSFTSDDKNTFHGSASYSLRSDAGRQTACWINNAERSGQVSAELEWFAPVEMAGATDVQLIAGYKCSGASDNPSRLLSTMNFTIAEQETIINILDPMLSTDDLHPNKIAVNYYTTQSLTGNISCTWNEDSIRGPQRTMAVTETPANNFGTIYLDADKEYYNFKIKGSYKYNSGSNPTLTESAPYAYIPSYRQIKFAEAPVMAFDNQGSVNLKFTIDRPEGKDIWDNIDFVEVERAFSPDFSDAESIGTFTLESGQAEYTLKDSSNVLLQHYNKSSSDWNTDYPKAYYRIARSSSQIWSNRGWATDSLTLLYTYGYITPTYFWPVLNKSKDWDKNHTALFLVPKENICLKDSTSVRGGKAYVDVIWNEEVAKWVLKYQGLYNDAEGNQKTAEFSQDISLEELLSGDSIEVRLERPCIQYKNFRLWCEPQEGYNLTDLHALDRLIDSHHIKDNFYYDSAGKAENLQASRGYYSNKVNLQWETDGGNIDRYSLERRKYTLYDEPWQVVASNLTEQFFTDTRITPGTLYEYRVKALCECNATVIEHISDVCYGYASATGTVDGYVRFPDGNGVPHVEVLVDGNNMEESNKDALLQWEKSGEATYLRSAGEMSQPQSFTVQMWVKPENIYKQNANEWTLLHFGDYKLSFKPRYDSGSHSFGIAFKVRGGESECILTNANDAALDFSSYTHLTATYDASADSIKLYQNGELLAAMKSTVKPAGTGQPAFMELAGEGTFIDGQSYLYLENGLIGSCRFDEVRLWNKALSSSEIKQNYSRILGGSENGLMLYWRLDEHDFSAGNPSRKRIADFAKRGEYDVRRMDGIVYCRRADDVKTVDGKVYCLCEEKDLQGGVATENGLGKDKLWYKGLTNETGYYRISGLPVQGETTYTLTPQSATGQKFSPDGGLSVTFDDTNYEKNNYNFDLTSYYMLSGTVLYEGSSIPVRQARFLVGGSELQRNGKAVTTNDQGEFEFYVPRGVNTVQVVKDGHTFMNNGYLLDEEGDKYYNFERPVYEVRFWDETKVKLMGRMVGGMTEGGKPLGRSLSTNNLGDSLRIVLQLEGDNTSWIVKDQLDDEVRTRHKEFTHLNAAYSNAVDYERHRIIIRPNEQTGEYIAELYPVQYKVVEASAEGYTTLFQEGKVGETLDLTGALTLVDSTATYVVGKDSLTNTVCYNALYDRIYRSEAKVTYNQINYDNQSYFGIPKYEAANMAGDKTTVPLYDANAKTYTFGYPVFQAGDFYAFEVSAHEDYYYNNDVLGKYSSSPLANTKVKVHNGFYAENKDVTVTLDSLGKSKIQVPVTNVTYTQAGTEALRSFSISATLENRTIESDVLHAFVMGGKQKPGGKIITSEPNACLMDILRDPPGSGSKSTLKQGTTYSYSYKYNFDIKAGIDLSITSGSGMNKYSGVIAGTVELGDNYNSSKNFGINLNLVSGYHIDKSSTLKISTSTDISTSSSQSIIGKDADVFIGAMQAMTITPMLSVRAIDEKMYQQMRGSELGKTLKVISSSVAENGNKYYLVSDESFNVGTDFTSDFVYTGYYIEKTLIPNLVAQRDQLLFTGTRAEAKQMAETLKAPVYWSCKPVGNKDFGGINSIVVAGKDSILTYNTSCDTVSYMIIEPEGYNPDVRYDKVYNINKSLTTWIGFLAQNEMEKVCATEKINTISFSGETSISYSETYQGDVNTSRYVILPTGIKADFPLVNGIEFIRNLTNFYNSKKSSFKNNSYELQFFGFQISLNLNPILEMNVGNPINGSYAISRNRTISYTLSANRRSNLSVDVLRASVARDTLASYVQNGWAAEADEYDRYMKAIHDEVDNGGAASFYDKDARYYSGIVFRTVGGATCCPYEDEYKPIYYNSNQVINQKTKRVEKPVLHVDQRSVSNVPIDKPAVFNLRITNEAEVPDPKQVGFNIFLTNNPKGAKVLIDGESVSDGYPLIVPAGEASYRTVEVWAGQDFDYDDLILLIKSDCEQVVSSQVAISAHFVPSAGEINFTTPESKWVMNTESPQEDGRYYLPVRIDKYNVNQRGFDHIELQYKLTNKPEKDWVNICSYYADSTLYAAAGGTKEMLGTNGYISARFFGETDPTEQLYDLRAVTYCRYGTGFVTSSTPVLSGVKDTRRPAPFGNTQPANGVLTATDDIKIIFSEDIAGNYLSKVNNFDVTGYLNSSEITQSTSLHFDGSTYAATNVKRNLSNKDFTIELLAYPEATHRDMTLFSHAGDDGRFALRLTGDNRLQAMVLGTDTAIVTSNEQLLFKGFTQLAATYDAGTHRLRLYQGNKLLAANLDTIPTYKQTGRLCFGAADPTGKDMSDAYVGNMLEARLWNKVLDPAELNQMSFKRLSGYEAGLVDCYPMNEGTGTTLHDKSQGATALLNAASWTLPKGMSVKLDGTADGIHLDERYFSRTATQDYTLSFWFKTARREAMALLCNGRADSTDTNAENKFYIGLENGRPVYRSGKHEARIDRDYSDGQWHHYALTVNRPRNLVNIFVDNALMTTFAVDSLGGFSSPRTYIGACHTLTEAEEGGFTDNVTDRFEGNIDDVMLWSAALPPTVISDIYNVNPNGDEMALVAWLPFSRSEKQMDNTYKLNFTPLSAKRYKDDFGNYTSRVDTLIIGDASPLTDKQDFAPMRDLGLKENVKFSYAAKNDQLIVNLDVPDKEIEGTTVYVTVKDVTDLNGNEMASPVMMWVYVNRNDLKWENNQIKQEFDYEWKEYMQFTTTIHNKGGKRRHYTIEGMPDWLTLTPIEGNVTALGSQDISFSINQSINPGTYDEVIYLVNDNGVAEPLALTIKVNPIRPDWSVNMDKSENSMSICGQIRINGKISTDPDDMVGVFCGNECIGVAHNSVDNVTGDSHVFLTVYGTSGTAENLNFYIWDSGTGAIYQAMLTEDGKPGTVLKFAANALHGTLQNPLIIEGGDILQQSIQLHAGCNWVSFAVKSPATNYTLGNVIKLLLPENNNNVVDFNTGANVNCMKGDIVRYKGNTEAPVDNKHLYKIKVQTPQTLRISGLLLQQPDECTINLLPGWNGIGFTPIANLPISEALADYYDEAADGDIIKSQDEFAIFTDDGAGHRLWRGNLSYLKAGEGYMMKRTAPTPASFTYPMLQANGSYAVASPQQMRGTETAETFRNPYASSMTMVAQVTGIDLEPGDRLAAFAGNELRGIATAASDGRFYLSIGGDMAAPLRMALLRGETAVAQTDSPVDYTVNAASGTYSAPTQISFASATGCKAGPNPFDKFIDFSAAAPAGTEVTFAVYNLGGTLVHRYQTTADAPLTEYRWTGADALAESVYIATITYNGESHSFKLIKQ